MTTPGAVPSVLFFAVLIIGCGKVFEYPDSEPEHGAELCSDGEDNDFDGNADCADSDCGGFCKEETLAECSDGPDNDGDRLGVTCPRGAAERKFTTNRGYLV